MRQTFIVIVNDYNANQRNLKLKEQNMLLAGFESYVSPKGSHNNKKRKCRVQTQEMKKYHHFLGLAIAFCKRIQVV